MMKLDDDGEGSARVVGRRVEARCVGKRERTRYPRTAKVTFREDQRLNTGLTSKDLAAIQQRVLEEGLPYQTLISSLLHNARPTASRKSGRCVEASAIDPTPFLQRIGDLHPP